MNAEQYKEIIVALIENSGWIIAVVTILVLALVFRAHIASLIDRIRSFEYKDFRLKVSNLSARDNFQTALINLQGLTQDQLHIFMILGGESGDNIQLSYPLPTNIFERSLDKLSDLQLISFEKDDQGYFHFQSTAEGRKLHKAIFDELYSQLVVRPETR